MKYQEGVAAIRSSDAPAHWKSLLYLVTQTGQPILIQVYLIS